MLVLGIRYSVNVYCNIVTVLPKHVDKNPFEDGHSSPKHVRDN
jgi:hypothetical protein